MKTKRNYFFGLLALLAGLTARPAAAQNINPLYSFTDGGDGASPGGALILSGGTLYGMAGGGGANNTGTVFAVRTNGTSFATLHSFAAGSYNSSGVLTNSDGAYPIAALVLSGNILYGTAPQGGINGCGTVFSLHTDGTGFAILHSCTALDPAFSTNSDGAYPAFGLTLSGGTLFGTADGGGANGAGTVFSLHTDGSGFATLHDFTALDPILDTNYDGAYPSCEMILSGGILYGTAGGGGDGGNGTVFAVDTNGNGFTILHDFAAGQEGYETTNLDGAGPGGLVQAGGTLFGTAGGGGANGQGTVFAVNTNGAGFAVLHDFTAGAGDYPLVVNGDGSQPDGRLLLSGNTLYGTAFSGGWLGNGTVFSLLTNGAGFTTLHAFTDGNDGGGPQAGLVLSGNTLYGTTTGGGSNDMGVVFGLPLNGLLTNSPSDFDFTNNVTLSYRTFASVKYNLNGGLAAVYWRVAGSGLELVFSEQDPNGNWTETILAGTAYLMPYPPAGEDYIDNGVNLYAPSSALLYDSQGNPHVVYVDFQNNLLIHYARTASGWQNLGQISIVTANPDDYFGAAMGPGDVIHVIAGGDANGYSGHASSYTYTPVHYCWKNGGWQDQTPLEGGMEPVSPGDYSVSLDYEPRPFSMVVDAGNVVHVAYTPQDVDVDNANGTSSSFSQLAYMSNPSGQWTNEIVYNPSDGHSDAGLGASIAMAPNGQPAIASFYDPRVVTGSSSGGSLLYHQRGANGVWTTTVVASSANGYTAGDGNTGTGFAPQLAFDYAGRPHIAFTDHASQHFSGEQDEFGGNLRHAWLYDGAWQIQTVYPQSDPIHNQCFFPNLALSQKNVAVMSLISRDQLNQNFTITNTLFHLNLTTLVPANYLDTTPPTLTITNPAAGQTVGNAVFAVRGAAGDNVMVSNVFYSLNNGGWGGALTANGWSNWNAAVTLVPGTNTVRAYAVDTSGNFSLTNRASVFYAQTAPLTILTNGLGSLTPNDAGQLLRLNQNYSITAVPASGFKFVGWTNGVTGAVSHTPALTFAMQSNLVLTATFADTNRPTLSITNLTAGRRLSNAAFTVQGIARDNWRVAGVWCQCDTGGWTSALGTTNWSVPVTLSPGTNSLKAYAMDTSGNLSTTNSVLLDFVVTNQLGVRFNGLGALTPNDSNAWLEVGRNYTLTAAPATGFAFTNWSVSSNWLGGALTNKPAVQFMMASNLTLTANFVETSKPVVTITNLTANRKVLNGPLVIKGTASDNWRVTNVWCEIGASGWVAVATTNSYKNWSVTNLSLVTGTNTVKVYGQNLGGNYSTTNSLAVVATNAPVLPDVAAKILAAPAAPVVSVTNARLTADGLSFTLQITGAASGLIQVSANLTAWETVTNFAGTNTALTFSWPAPPNSDRRFYRAVIP